MAILVGGHLGIIPVNLNQIGLRLKEEFAFKANYLRFSIFSSGDHFVHRSDSVEAILVAGHLCNIPMKFKRISPGV